MSPCKNLYVTKTKDFLFFFIMNNKDFLTYVKEKDNDKFDFANSNLCSLLPCFNIVFVKALRQERQTQGAIKR
jgi:hypothetical protein